MQRYTTLINIIKDKDFYGFFFQINCVKLFEVFDFVKTQQPSRIEARYGLQTTVFFLLLQIQVFYVDKSEEQIYAG